MGEKETINQEFDRLQNKVSYSFFPNFLNNVCMETNLTSLCYVPSFRKHYNQEELNYELFLQEALKRILVSIDEEKNNRPVRVFNLLNSDDEKPLNKVIKIYCPDLIKRIEHLTENKIYKLFGYDVVLLNDDFERLFDFLRIVDLYDVRIEIIKTILDVFINKKESKEMVIVSLKREKDSFYHYSRLFPEYIDDINDYLIENNCRYVSFKDFTLDVLETPSYELLNTKINEYSNWVNELESGEHYTEMLFKAWHYYGDLKFIFLEDLKHIYDSEPLSLFDKVDDFKLCSFEAFNHYFMHLDVSLGRNKDWISSLFSAEKLFNDIGYLKGGDNTSLVTGYLKSIEQLLGNLIIDDSNTYKYVPSYFHKGKEVIINEKTLNKVGTLGNLNMFIKYNPLFIKNKKHKDLLFNLIDEYRDSTRNGYFHKDSILSYERVNNIRKDTIALTIVILNVYYSKDDYDGLYINSSPNRMKVFDVVCKGDVSKWGRPPFTCLYRIKNIDGKNISYLYYSIEKYNTLHCFNFYYEADKNYIKSNKIVCIERWDDINRYLVDERSKEEKTWDSLRDDDTIFKL